MLHAMKVWRIGWPVRHALSCCVLERITAQVSGMDTAVRQCRRRGTGEGRPGSKLSHRSSTLWPTRTTVRQCADPPVCGPAGDCQPRRAVRIRDLCREQGVSEPVFEVTEHWAGCCFQAAEHRCHTPSQEQFELLRYCLHEKTIAELMWVVGRRPHLD